MSLTAPMPSAMTRSQRANLVLVREGISAAQDAALTAGRQPSTTPFSKEMLFRHFVTTAVDIAEKRNGSGVEGRALLIAALQLVDAVLSDDSPTPQVSQGPEDGIAVEWLVDRRSLTIHFVSSSDIRMWADDALGSELFDFELNSNWSPDGMAVTSARELLAEMGREVRSRVPLKT